ncbi:MAG: LysM peptidoglycan-binding domain-containing protein [Phycisphaerae bacterium]|jgi:nucleoid-associated protein YgaU
MRYVTTILILVAVAAIGCNNQKKAPETTTVMEPPAPAPETATSIPPAAPLPVAEPVPAAPRGLETLSDDAPASPSAAAGTYVVQPGDTFFKIARKLYGEHNVGKRAREIQAANPGLDPRKIKPGQVINVPEN